MISIKYQKTQLSLIRGCSWTPPIKKYRSKSSDRKHCKAKHRVIIKEDYWDEAGLGWQCVKVRIAWEQKYLIQRREANVAIQQQPTVFSEVFSQHFFFVFTFAVLIRTRLRSSQKTHLYFPLLLFRSTNKCDTHTHTHSHWCKIQVFGVSILIVSMMMIISTVAICKPEEGRQFRSN